MPEKTPRTRKIQKQEKKPLLNKKLLAISITLAITIIMGAVLYQYIWRSQEAEVRFSLKAAIIDQLSEDENLRNQTFVNEVSAILMKNNFSVDYYNYTKTNVAFFKGLAKANYGIIILRIHSALRMGGSTVDFFTSEPYTTDKYIREQEEELLVNGTITYSGKQYFAFTSKFVEELEGNFPKSIVIAMGCQSLNQTAGQPMARAFCRKGAKVYIGWSGWVSATHSDEETIKLLQRLLHENKTIGEAVEEASPDFSCGPSYLKFYPNSPSVRDLKISDLIKEAQTSYTSLKSALFEDFYIAETSPVKRFNSLATVMYSWFRSFSPVRFNVFNFLISSASTASSITSFIHFSKSPR
jgi:hypothetical protein